MHPMAALLDTADTNHCRLPWRKPILVQRLQQADKTTCCRRELEKRQIRQHLTTPKEVPQSKSSFFSCQHEQMASKQKQGLDIGLLILKFDGSTRNM
jgi:hypothetical protein